jgi:hypothetical protein
MGGISGPLYTLLADVETITGSLKTPAVLARATVLLTRVCRSIEPTPKANPAWWSIRSRAQPAGVSRGDAAVVM